MLLELLLFDGNNRTYGNANKRHFREAGAGEDNAVRVRQTNPNKEWIAPTSAYRCILPTR